MNKHYIFILLFFLFSMNHQVSWGQACDSLTPTFNVNLVGQPGGTWTSPPVQRDGNCCTVDNNCVEFNVMLDSNANGILFDIISGALPGGALFYQINCGPVQSLGTMICLSGPGPHIITFCKPGNNTNVYQISSIPKPDLDGSIWVTQACVGMLGTVGMIDTSIHWTSVPFNALYNSYLNCLDGCDSVTVTPTGIVPAYVDYQVCGYVMGGCVPFFFCDTMRVHFANNLDVQITPVNPVICFGGPNATVTANVIGGLSPFNFLWSNGATSQSISVGAGTYTVSLTDSMNCTVAIDTVIVSALPSPIQAIAGPDQLYCTNQQSISLSGTIIAAMGGQWLGGSGSYTPNDTTMIASYIPTPAEISAGSVQLMLVTTGNSSCPADTDLVMMTLSPSPSPVLSGSDTICEYETNIYTTPFVAAHTYSWSVTGGSIVANSGNSISVHWNAAGAGNVTLTETNSATCDSTVSINVIIDPKPVPVINGPPVVCTTTTSTFAVATPVAGNTYSWSISGPGSISGAANASSVNIQWTSTGSATVTVTQTNTSGCDSTVSYPVTILAQPVPVISGIDTVCLNDARVYTVTFIPLHTYSWSVTGGAIIFSSANLAMIRWNTVGSGSVTVTEQNTATCDSTVTLNVYVAPLPTPVITGPAVVCVPAVASYSVVIPVPANSYSWSVTGGIIIGVSNATTVNIQWSNPGSASLTLTETTIYGCDSTVSYPVQNYIQPVPAIAGPDTVCYNEVASYSTAFSSTNTYGWTVTGGTLLTVINNIITVQWNTVGAGSVTVTEQNTPSCDSTVVFNVVIGPLPAPFINGAAIVCSPAVVTYNLPLLVPGNNYNWSVSGGSVIGPSNTNTLTVQWPNAGTHMVTVTESNGFGCDSTTSLPVTVFEQPVPVIAGPDTVCNGAVVIYSTTLFSSHIYNWMVNGGTILSFSNNTVTVKWTNGGWGTVTVTEQNTIACDSTVTLNVWIAPQPAPVIQGPIVVCNNTYSTYSIVNPDPADFYSWGINGGNIIGSSTGSSILVRWNTIGTSTIQVTESNSVGCDSTISIQVTVLTKPAPVLSGPPEVCQEDTATYSVPFVAGDNYIWTVTNGSILNLNISNSVDVLWSSAGNGEVRLRQVSPTGCDSVVNEFVLVNPIPQPAIIGPSISCEQEGGTYTVNPNNGTYYNWTVSGGISNGSVVNDSISVLWTTPGTGSLTLVETTPEGCSNTASYAIQVNPKPYPVIGGSQVGCVSSAINNYSVNPQPGIQYQWTATGGTVVSGNGSANAGIQWNTPGVQTLTVNAINPVTGCDSSVTITVTTDTLAQPSVLSASVSGCAPVSIDFTGNNFQPGNNYLWSFGDGGTSLSPNPSYVYNTPGTYQVQVIVTNQTGCMDSAQSQITAYSLPVADFNMNYESGIRTYYIELSTLELENLSVGATNYLWSFGNGNTSTLFEPLYEYTQPGHYPVTLLVTNQWGCKDMITHYIDVKLPENIYIPNAFTPNGDDKNDQFGVETLNITDFSITIFNRWGECIYVSSDPSFQWNGDFKGGKVPNDTYVYVVSATGYHGTHIKRTGTVTVLR